jgi:hypothetical protein
MQFSTQAARRGDEPGSIRSLHLSLNAPVIAIDELPVGPARAGVVLCALPEGGFQLQIAIRSLRTGEVVAVASDLEAPGPTDEVAAIEAALSYAEGMGFLFDEDEVGAGGDAAADKVWELWRDLVEDAPERSRSRERMAAPEAPNAISREAGEADVHEVPICESGSEVRSIEVEHAETVTIDRSAETISLPAPETLLSKFRLVLDGARAEPDAPEPDASVATAQPPQESRIRLLSRF